MSSDEKDKFPINSILIIEVLGRPKEHLIETLEGIIKQITEEKGVEFVEKKIHEPKEIEKQPGMFTTYAEIEINVESILHLTMLSFKYMPAHIEMIEPENVSLTNVDASELLNEITRRMHQYDEVARVIQMEKQILENQLKRTITPQIKISENVEGKDAKTSEKKPSKGKKTSKKSK